LFGEIERYVINTINDKKKRGGILIRYLENEKFFRFVKKPNILFYATFI